MNKKILQWGSLLTSGLLLLDMLFLETYFFDVNTFYIGRNNGGKKIKLLLLTDLHFKKRLGLAHLKLAKKVNSLRPDLILIAGDIVDEYGTAAPAKKFFNLLNYSIPKIAILGNHDHKSVVTTQEYRELLAQNNGVLLLNETVSHRVEGHKITITGVDDFIEGEPSLVDAVEQIGREENHLLLIHSPKQQEKIKKQLKKINGNRTEDQRLNIQYIFAGHNHGGQVRLLGYAPVMPKKAGKYFNGWYNNKPPYLYVSKGFGTSTLPFRFSSRAEVTVFNYGV
ncbi:MAG TPA: metallophosphoesterase [Segetibacter sp.]